MHAHNRTLIAKLGFADPDKKEPLHDIGCRYLAQHEQMMRLLEAFTKEEERVSVLQGESYFPGRRDMAFRPKASLEVAVSKGEDKYKTTIGFIDVAISYDVTGWRTGDAFPQGGPERRDFTAINGAWKAYVEVKASPCSYSDLLRQINLYREYVSGGQWFAAVTFDVAESYARALAEERVRLVRLGAKFREWAERARAEDKTATIEEI